MEDNAYRTVNDGIEGAKSKAQKVLQKYLIWVVLLFNVALEVVTRLYTFGFRNPFTLDFFLSVFLDTVTTMICYACFIVIGQMDEKKKSLTYAPNIKTWGELTEKVREKHLEAFRIFCREQVDVERNEAKRLILGNATVISFEEYLEKYLEMGKKDLKNELISGRITKEEYKALYKANGFGLFNPTKIKAINPVIILSGVAKGTLNDAGRTESNFVARWLTTRPLLIFATTTILNTISTTFVGMEQNAILGMFISVLSIIVASVIGYGAGQQAIRDKEDRVKSRIIFISLFLQKIAK